MTASLTARLAAASAAAALLLAAAPARGHSPCDPTDNDRAEASRVIGQVREARFSVEAEINEMERNVVETLRLQTGQLGGYEAESTKTLVEAMDSKMKLEAQLTREELEAERQIAHRPHRAGCETATGATGLAASRAAAEDAAVRHDADQVGRIARDAATEPQTAAAADHAARYRELLSLYCAPGRSPGNDEACAGDADMHAADLRPGALFDVPTYPDETAAAVAESFAENVAAPTVTDPPRLGAVETDAERREILRARGHDARAALAADAFGQARAMRVPGVDLGPWAAAMGAEGRDPALPVSRHELLRILASERFEDPDWFIRLQEMNAEALLREIASLLAIDLMLDWERYRLAERDAGVAAAHLAVGVEAARGR